MRGFIDELKRRNVVRVAVAYLIAGWLVFQVGEILFPTFGAPDWVFKTLILLIAIGFPFALIFAWAFELTPDGVKKSRDVSEAVSVTASTGKKLNLFIIASLVLALGYFIWERQARVESGAPASTVETPAGRAPDEDLTDTAPNKKRSIAVLPFADMSQEKDQEWFADGLTEEILNSLARTPDLLVAARTSSFSFKGSKEDIPTIAAALGVAHVLEGSVRRSADRLRVTAQLIRASDGFHLWSETYDSGLDDLIDIQENVAVEIAKALETAMDPEALAQMVSSGTRSVPAFEAYLAGLAYGVSTVNTGDVYEFLSARDAFERAIELDPQFALAYWELAQFWDIQLSATNIVSGITDLPSSEMQAAYDNAVDNAIRYEKDPVSKIHYRASKARSELKFRQSLQLYREFLEARPNTQNAQVEILAVYRDLGMHQQAAKAVAEFYERDGFDTLVTQASLTTLLTSGDNEGMRTFARNAIQRFANQSVFVLYQAHRTLLWAGDIDGASQLVPVILASDMPETSRYLVSLRQACAENRVADAARLYANARERLDMDHSITWLSHVILGHTQEAIESLRDLDTPGDLRALSSFLSYGYFDPQPYPNIMALLQSQGIERAEPIDVPYRCRSPMAAASDRS